MGTLKNYLEYLKEKNIETDIETEIEPEIETENETEIDIKPKDHEVYLLKIEDIENIVNSFTDTKISREEILEELEDYENIKIDEVKLKTISDDEIEDDKVEVEDDNKVDDDEEDEDDEDNNDDDDDDNKEYNNISIKKFGEL